MDNTKNDQYYIAGILKNLDFIIGNMSGVFVFNQSRITKTVKKLYFQALFDRIGRYATLKETDTAR